MTDSPPCPPRYLVSGTMADPTVVVDNLHVVYRVYGAGGNKGTEIGRAHV